MSSYAQGTRQVEGWSRVGGRMSSELRDRVHIRVGGFLCLGYGIGDYCSSSWTYTSVFIYDMFLIKHLASVLHRE